jgi:hypothetical protein
MASQTTIKHTAADKVEGLTLAELIDFVEETKRAGIHPGAVVKADIKITSKVKRIEVTG